MVYDVLIRRTNDHFTATVLNLPGCTVEAATRFEAIQQAQAAAASLIAASEVVQIELAPLKSEYPLASFAGMWADDETFEEFAAAMTTYRQQVDADASQP